MSTTAIRQLPLPTFFKAKNAEDWAYEPDQAALFGLADAWVKKHDIKPSGHDGKKVHLLLIDVQKDFCFPQGSLYVGGRGGKGAMEDNRKMAEFIYRNLGTITDLTCTMDTHFPFQIFFPSFWEDKDGKPLAAHTVIKSEMIKAGDVRPTAAAAQIVCDGNYSWLLGYVKHYCEALEKAKKYTLYLWPFHCLLGSSGHVLSGAVEEARIFHAFVRKSVNSVEVKGGNLLTENYSVLSPEVLTRHDGKPLAQRNTAFIKKLLESDAVIIAGQAASHCVKSSIEDLLSSINAQDPKLVKKVYIMKDCMSSVAVPDGKGGFFADFTAEAEKALKLFADAGMHVVDSVTPIEDWEGFPA
jgi:nicotinamidase-related amidase